MEILPFGDAYLAAGCLVLKGRSPRGAVPKVWDAAAPSRPPGAVSRLGGRPQELLESHLVTSPAFPQPHTVLAHGLQAGLGSTAQRVLAEWSHQHWQSSPTPQAAGTAGVAMDHPAAGAHPGPGNPASSPRSSAYPWASGTAAKCSLSALGRYGRMRAE